jgi:hypothetical protein
MPGDSQRPPSRDDYLALGFGEGSGSLLRLYCSEYVVDVLPSISGGYTRVELRGGSPAARIPLRVNTVADLEALARMLELQDR